MFGKNKNNVFRFIALFIAIYIVNLGADSTYLYFNNMKDLPENNIESVVELILEVGLDVEDAIPETSNTGTGNPTNVEDIFDWFHFDHDNISLLKFTSLISNKCHAGIIDIREHILEIIPPPPKV